MEKKLPEKSHDDVLGDFAELGVPEAVDEEVEGAVDDQTEVGEGRQDPDPAGKGPEENNIKREEMAMKMIIELKKEKQISS